MPAIYHPQILIVDNKTAVEMRIGALTGFLAKYSSACVWEKNKQPNIDVCENDSWTNNETDSRNET